MRSRRSSTPSPRAVDAALVEYTNRFDRVRLTPRASAPLGPTRLPPAHGFGATRDQSRPCHLAAERIDSSSPQAAAGTVSIMSMQPACGSASAGGRLEAVWSLCPGRHGVLPLLGADERRSTAQWSPASERTGHGGAGAGRDPQPRSSSPPPICSGNYAKSIAIGRGAQAVAALAYGTATISAVDKIVEARATLMSPAGEGGASCVGSGST